MLSKNQIKVMQDIKSGKGLDSSYPWIVKTLRSLIKLHLIKEILEDNHIPNYKLTAFGEECIKVLEKIYE